MIISTATLLTIDWECRFQDGRRWLLSKRTREEAADMLEEKVRPVHKRLPEWVRERLPASDTPRHKIRYPKRPGSFLIGVAENVAEGLARGGTASGVFVDEASRQHSLQAIHAAAMPMCDKFVAVTTAEIGNPGAEFFDKILREGREQDE